jgi:hypothetical protein
MEFLKFARHCEGAYAEGATSLGNGVAHAAERNESGIVQIAIKGTDCDDQHFWNMIGPGLMSFIGVDTTAMNASTSSCLPWRL